MAEAVKVVVRCRPMNTREKNLKCQVVVDIDGKIAQCALRNPNDSKAPPKTFTFDGAYGEDSTTEQIYADIGYPLVEGVTEGYNGTIFAYGQTGCGKSFSMQGINDPPTQRGIIPRAFDHIFETIQASDNAKYLVHSSYLEIYNEEIRDLLGKDVKAKLELKEHPDRGVYVQGLSMVPCKNVKECQHIMDRGWKNRSVGATLMNADSSRSHSIFSIHLERCEQDDKGEEHIRAAKLNLVDLAGSERQAKTGSTGERLKEATKINLSLSALGNVISALVDGKSKHIPYRDSKLTRLLQDSLGGNTKTLMVACLSPADNNYDETLSTLRYANRAKNIKNKPKINEDPKDALLREYQEEINKLKMMLRGEIPVQLEGGGAIKPKAAPSKMQPTNEELEIEKQRIREEYEEKMEQMKSEFDKMKLSKEQLEDEMMKLKDQYDNELATIVKPVASPGEEVELMSITDSDKASEFYPDPSDAEYLAQPDAQQAVHLNTIRKDVEGILAPRSSPTGIHNAEMLAHDEALRRNLAVQDQTVAIQRLEELQQAMVGGEQANNEEVKERIRKKKKYAEERNRKLKEALAQKDGDDIMLDIFDNTQMDLEKQRKALEKQKQKNEALQQEIRDLQSEFEFDRIDYLDTIRKQEQQIKWLQAVIDRIHPCLRRDSNYMNLDKIKMQSQWDEDSQCWILPKMTIEKARLPGVTPGSGRQETHLKQNGEIQPSIYDELRSEDRYLEKLNRNTEQDVAKDYFKSKRAEKLLKNGNDDKYRGNSSSPVGYPLTNGIRQGSAGKPPTAWQNDSTSDVHELHAASVHRQPSAEEMMARKPLRLESLAPTKSGRKKKKQYTIEQL